MSLSALGLSALQQACYRTLLVEPFAGVDVMAAQTGARVDEVEAALQGLRTLHLVIDAPDTPSGAAAVRPARALVELAGARARAHTRELLAIAETHREIQALDELVAQRAGFARVPAAEPFVEVLQGPDAIQAFLDELAYSSRVSCASTRCCVPCRPCSTPTGSVPCPCSWFADDWSSPIWPTPRTCAS